MTMTAPTITAITFDCRDVAAQSTFWSQLLDRPIEPGANEYFASIGAVHDPSAKGPTLLFLGVEGERRMVKNPIHLDLHADDLDAAVARAVDLGAERVAHFDEYGVEWVTLRDPEGNLFDIGRPSSAP